MGRAGDGFGSADARSADASAETEAAPRAGGLARRAATTVGRNGARAVSLPAALAWSLVAIGAVLRVAVYAKNRSLWHDEARLALNIIDRSYAELFGRLDFNQAAPPGFLVVEKLVVDAFGDGEYALRLVPLLCGIASLVLFWKLAEMLLAPWAAVASLALFAVAEPLLYYASEVKQYGVDVFASLAVLYLAARFRQSRFERRHAVTLAALGLLLVWFSHAATVTLAGVTAAFAVEAVHARDRRRLRMLIGVAAVWIVSGAVYAGFATGAVGRLRERFASGLPDAFAPLPPTSLSDVKWYAANVHGFAQELGGSELWAVLGIGLAVVGVASLARRDAGALGLLVWPVVLVVLASGLELYPLQFRFQVFLAPTAFLLIGEGLSRVRSYVGVPAFVVLVGVLAALPLRVTVDALRDGGREEIRPLVEELASDARAGDTLYVYFASQYALSYYAQCDDCGTRPVARAFPIRRPRGSAGHERSVAGEPPSLILGRPGSLGPGRLGDDIARLSGKERAWLLFAHDVTAFGTDERELALASAGRLGRMISARETTGAALYLFDFGGEP